MLSVQLTDEKVQELRRRVEGWGRILAEEAFGPDGPDLNVDMATIEDLAVTMQQALLKGLCEEATRRQSQRLPETQPCPDCGAECPVESQSEGSEDDPGGGGRSRRLQLRGGAFELAEPRCYCRSCRRSFFPSADGAASRRARL